MLFRIDVVYNQGATLSAPLNASSEGKLALLFLCISLMLFQSPSFLSMPKVFSVVCASMGIIFLYQTNIVDI